MNWLPNNTERIVKSYGEREGLSKVEKTIFHKVIGKTKLKKMSLLDLGIGGGRTTKELAPLVKRYVGSDYSKKMVSFCIEKYPKVDLRVVDATDLGGFAADSFDVVFFSFNGISEIEFNKLDKVFYGIRRVLREGGYFVFSFTNIDYFEQKFKVKSFPRKVILHLMNRKRKPYEMHKKFYNLHRRSYLCQTLVDIETMLSKLRRSYFSDVKLFSNITGQPADIEELKKKNSTYVCCNKREIREFF